MRYFLLLVNAANGIFNDTLANTEIEYSYIGTAKVEKGDRIAGFVTHPVGQIRMLFEASRDSADNKLYLKKKIDIFDGVETRDFKEVVDVIDTAEAVAEDLSEIDEKLYEEIRQRLVQCVIGENEEEKVTINPLTGYTSEFPRNRIIFGAPGTGKSYEMNCDRMKLLGEDNVTDYERVTFHPDYTYANFVGTYKPVPDKDEKGHTNITYEYVPGPFMRILVKALQSAKRKEKKPFLLLIEEINRANVAAVFGDIFQLLDRGENYVSEYPVQTSEDVKRYLSKPEVLGGTPGDYEQLRIPDNMFIWATMNSADQGVYPMDTAFKRRWDFKYIGIDEHDDELKGKTVVLGQKPLQYRVEWNELRKQINNFMANKGINEDKQLGPYFISKKIIIPENGSEIDAAKFSDVFKNKVIMYLFEDAMRQKRDKLFEGVMGDKTRYSSICKEFDKMGVFVFNKEISSKLTLDDDALPEDENV